METPVPRTLATNVPIVEREGRLQKALRTATVSCPFHSITLFFSIVVPGRFNGENKKDF
jgi:hypothetical protein